MRARSWLAGLASLGVRTLGTGSNSINCPSKMPKALQKVRTLGHGPLDTPDPFLFCVYHKDNYPAGNSKMEVTERVGNGNDFNPDAEYRMYHGGRVPGFPQHPHRGFETITATLEGLCDHTDSLGNAGRFGDGDLMWMTAGKGIVHGEMFPLVEQEKRNKLRFFQIWINLPKKSKMVEPDFEMQWAEEVKVWQSADEKARVIVWAGEFDGVKSGGTPPKNSWANEKDGNVGVYHISLDNGGVVEIPATKGPKMNRYIYLVEGQTVEVDGTVVKKDSNRVVLCEVDPALPITLKGISSTPSEFLVLEGRPIEEPVAQHGPFVMNSQDEIAKAFQDYQQTKFGGWPWKEDAVIHPREKGRFALVRGKETTPPG
mmetsp:Transcript_21900/g.35254  ORF Transcript_21900/g.35254 Transcript_21900/m.35254 type:complete len:371 (+) Transcript_21900:326-1438(+)